MRTGLGSSASRGRTIRALLVAVCSAALASALLIAVAPSPAGATGAIPTQWIAQQYTEILGRAPSTSEFATWSSYYSSNQCTVSTLKNLSSQLLTGTTFTANYPEGAAGSAGRRSRVLALIRAVFHREPTTSDWTTYFSNGYGLSSSPWTWTTTIDNIFADSQFADVSSGMWLDVCSTSQPNYGFSSASYGFTAPVYEGTSRTQAQLQSTLDAAKPSTCVSGTTVVNVTLNPREVIKIGGSGVYGQGLHVWPCEKLTTAGTFSGGTGQYASFGRIVPNGPNAQIYNVYWPYRTGLVRLDPGAQMSYLWVDGKGVDTTVSPKLSLIESGGSTSANPSTVSFSKISEPPAGGTGMTFDGYSTTAQACAGAAAVQDLVTGYASPSGYSSSHATDSVGRDLSVDGVNIACENATIWINNFVDISGNAVVLEGVWNRSTNTALTQQSQVLSNTVLSAGVSGYSAYGADPVGECMAVPGPGKIPLPVSCLDKPSVTYDGSFHESSAQEADFAGSSIHDNVFYNGGRTHFDVGLELGYGARWGDNGRSGKNATFVNNTSTTGTVLNVGIGVSKMYNATLTGNTASYTLSNVIGDSSGDLDGCGQTSVAIDSTHASLATGSQAATAVPIYGCLFGHLPENGMERIQVDPTNADQLASATSGATFYPWGGALGGQTEFETWSSSSIPTAVHDIDVARQLGVNVLRIFVQLPEMIDPPDGTHPNGTANATHLAQLRQLVDLAASMGVYTDVTGLAGPQVGDCPDQDSVTSGYQNTDPSCWYDAVTNEAARWNAQAYFWTSVANTLKTQPGVMAYSLISEPLDVSHAPGCDGVDHPSGWYGGGPGCGGSGSYYTQALTQWPGTRTQAQIRAQWISKMTDAIRSTTLGAGDTNHLVTMGQFVWAVNGNDPEAVDATLPAANKLSYISYHQYPSSVNGNLSTALTSGTAVTSLSLQKGSPFSLTSGTQVSVISNDGAHTQTVTLSAALALNATTMSVVSFVPNFSYPAATSLVRCPGQGSSCSNQALSQAVNTTASFKVDGSTPGSTRKPLVVEEYYPLSATPTEMDQFIQDANSSASVRGWLGQIGGQYSVAQISAIAQSSVPGVNVIAQLTQGEMQTFMRLAPYLWPCGDCQP